jgi:hypothetical protein
MQRLFCLRHLLRAQNADTSTRQHSASTPNIVRHPSAGGSTSAHSRRTSAAVRFVNSINT